MASSPAFLRIDNRARVLAALRRGPASKAALAQASGLSRPTAGAIVDGLIADGLVHLEGGVDRGQGRPGQLLALDAQQPAFAVAQWDGQSLRSGLLPLAPPSGDDEQTFATLHQGPQSMTELIRSLRSVLRRASGLRALALSVSGVLDGEVLRFSHRLPWAVERSLGTELSKALKLPVLVVQEIQALALGHAAAQPDDDAFLLVDSGAGVGAAACRDGRVLDGLGGMSGEIGHSPVPGNSRHCGCGAVGCVETLLNDESLLQCSDGELAAGAQALGAALNAWGGNTLLCSGGFAQLDDGRWRRFANAVSAASLAGRCGRLRVERVPRRRALGLHLYCSHTMIDHPRDHALES